MIAYLHAQRDLNARQHLKKFVALGTITSYQPVQVSACVHACVSVYAVSMLHAVKSPHVFEYALYKTEEVSVCDVSAVGKLNFH